MARDTRDTQGITMACQARTVGTGRQAGPCTPPAAMVQVQVEEVAVAAVLVVASVPWSVPASAHTREAMQVQVQVQVAAVE